jgi:hypothetical protein
MIRARHIWVYETFFRFYTGWMLKRHFHRIHVDHKEQPVERALLLIGNHFSWWDGFIGNYLNFTYFRKRFHVMMLEEQLENRMFLNRAGAFSIKKSSRSVAVSLAYAKELLSNPDNLLLFFPQGKIETLYTRKFTFERGIEKILEGHEEAPVIVFFVNLVDYFSEPKPSLFIRTRRYEGERSTEAIQKAYEQFFDDCVSLQVEDLV